MQQLIDFESIVHVRENRASNEAILNSQRKRLSKNCETILSALLRGERLSGLTIIYKYGMTEYRKRIADLKDAGVEISEEILSNGSKVWFMDEKQRIQ